MSSKQKVIDSLTKANYSVKEVIGLINSVTPDAISPPYIKKGDCFLDQVGAKRRPCCVIKVIGEVAYAIPLSTTLDSKTLLKGKKSRFSTIDNPDCYFSKSLVCASVGYVKDNYVFSYEDLYSLNKAIREMRKLINKVLY